MSRPAQISSNALTLQMQSQGLTSAQALAAGLRVDRSTVSRGLSSLGSQVLRVGAARSARYALRRSVRQAGNRWPLYRIDPAGRPHELGVLHAFHGGYYWETSERAPAWFRQGYAGGIFPGVPFFLSDVRPQGFMGRATARTQSAALGVPSDPRDWQDDDVLGYLLAQGDDLPGDRVLGERMLERALQRPAAASAPSAIPENERNEHYVALANVAMAGEPTGSSAGGEQPKFAAAVRAAGGVPRQVLVKFSSSLATPAGRRWADLLAAEQHALRVLAAHGEETASTTLIDAGPRRFLEVTRFDRAGVQGRRGVVTLQAIEAGLLDERVVDWPAVARAMAAAGMLTVADAGALRRRWCFGQLIGNTDMHLGNASVWFSDVEPFRLAPAYDMLPMLWAPGAQGEIVPREFVPPSPLPGIREEWHAVMPWAQEFWQQVQDDSRISSEFRALAAGANIAITVIQQRLA